MIIINAANMSGKRSDNLNQKIHKMKSKGESIFGLSDWINEIIAEPAR